jgi:hypothetical protein
MSDDLPKIVNGNFLLPEVYDRYKLLLHKNDLNIVIDSDKDMSKLLHFTQLIFDMLKCVLGRALLCYVPKKKNLGRLIYSNDADVLSETYNLITFLKICAACSRLSCFVFFFKSSVIREEILLVNFKFSFSIRAIYDRYKLLLHKNDLNIVIDSDKDMSKLLHFTQLIFNMLKSVLISSEKHRCQHSGL